MQNVQKCQNCRISWPYLESPWKMHSNKYKHAWYWFRNVWNCENVEKQNDFEWVVKPVATFKVLKQPNPILMYVMWRWVVDNLHWGDTGLSQSCVKSTRFVCHVINPLDLLHLCESDYMMNVTDITIHHLLKVKNCHF